MEDKNAFTRMAEKALIESWKLELVASLSESLVRSSNKFIPKMMSARRRTECGRAMRAAIDEGAAEAVKKLAYDISRYR
ncbi:MAG: hypothetical protein ACK5MU_04070 [Candidatus Saccharimonadales bacterium]